MKNGFIVLLFSINVLLFSGCASSQSHSKSQNNQQYTKSFNQNDKRLVFVEGKPFSVPRSANYAPRRATIEEAKTYQEVGISCNTGDLFWLYGSKQAELSELIKKGYAQCSYPLNKQEYQYRLNQEKERTKVLNDLAGFNTPKVNVEHSGSINHNIYRY